MVLRKKVKVVCFLSPRLVEQYSALAETFGVTKSELYRKTLERGFKSTSEWCEAALSPVAPKAPAPVAGSRSRVASVQSRPAPAARSPVLDLGKFADALVEMQPDIERPVFESMVTAQGRVLGLDLDVVRPVVDQLATSRFGGAPPGGSTTSRAARGSAARPARGQRAGSRRPGSRATGAPARSGSASLLDDAVATAGAPAEVDPGEEPVEVPVDGDDVDID